MAKLKASINYGILVAEMKFTMGRDSNWGSESMMKNVLMVSLVL